MKAITDTIVAYKLVWLRVICYWLVPTGLSFLALCKDIDGVKWHAMTTFDQFKIILECNLAGVLAFVAFMDSSMTRAKETASQFKVKREAQDEASE